MTAFLLLSLLAFLPRGAAAALPAQAPAVGISADELAELNLTPAEWKGFNSRGIRTEGEGAVDRRGRPLSRDQFLSELLRATKASLKALKRSAALKGPLNERDLALARHILHYRIPLFQNEAERNKLYRFLEDLLAAAQAKPHPLILEDRRPEDLFDRAEQRGTSAPENGDASVVAAPSSSEGQPETSLGTGAAFEGRSRSAHFRVIVTGAPDEERGRSAAGLIAAQAEEQYAQLSRRWLGRVLDLGEEPVEIRVSLAEAGPSSGPSAKSQFQYDDRGRLAKASIAISAPLQEALASMLPHQLTHLLLHRYFGSDIPPAFDEGAAASGEGPERRAAASSDMINYISQGEALGLYELFSLRQRPEEPASGRLFDVQGQSVAEFLLAARGGDDGAHRALVQFFAEASASGPDSSPADQGARWDGAVKKYYGFEGLSALNSAWLAWASGPGQVPPVPDGGAVEPVWGEAPLSRFENPPAPNPSPKPPSSPDEGSGEDAPPPAPPKEDAPPSDSGGGDSGGGFSCAKAADPAKDADGAGLSAADGGAEGSPLCILAFLLLPALRDGMRRRPRGY